MVLRGSETVVLSMEGVTQGKPITIIIYGLGDLLLIQALCHHVVDAKRQTRQNTLQVWYTDYSPIMPTFAWIKEWFA